MRTPVRVRRSRRPGRRARLAARQSHWRRICPCRTARSPSSASGEGSVEVVAWAGYVEDGSNDPAVDWVSSFEESTGCEVNVTLGNTSDEMFTLMQTGNYDLVSASGDASNRLIASGTVQPINLNLIPNYADVFEGLKNQPHNTVDGVPYGVPHGRGANLLDVQHRRRDARAGQLVHRVGAGLAWAAQVRRQRHGLRQPHLHRRRRGLPDGHAARAGHPEPVRARRRPSSPPRSTCSSSSAS